MDMRTTAPLPPGTCCTLCATRRSTVVRRSVNDGKVPFNDIDSQEGMHQIYLSCLGEASQYPQFVVSLSGISSISFLHASLSLSFLFVLIASIFLNFSATSPISSLSALASALSVERYPNSAGRFMGSDEYSNKAGGIRPLPGVMLPWMLSLLSLRICSWSPSSSSSTSSSSSRASCAHCSSCGNLNPSNSLPSRPVLLVFASIDSLE
mmetsp:Transcript_29679/g.40777  ORF Transcript_29679/g.40777 Transcript_29679/m.40777 type:complete len:208 (-) Transcript_29679:967-1590(-)